MLKTFSLHRQFKFHVILILNFISFYFMFFISKLKCFVLFLSENNIYYTKSMCLVCWQFLATRDKGIRPEFQGIYKKRSSFFLVKGILLLKMLKYVRVELISYNYDLHSRAVVYDDSTSFRCLMFSWGLFSSAYYCNFFVCKIN